MWSLYANQVSGWMGFLKEWKRRNGNILLWWNSDWYLEMLTSHVIPQLQSSGKLNGIIFWQDSAPLDFWWKVTEFLKGVFGEHHVTSRGFTFKFTFSLLDFYLWGRRIECISMDGQAQWLSWKDEFPMKFIGRINRSWKMLSFASFIKWNCWRKKIVMFLKIWNDSPSIIVNDCWKRLCFSLMREKGKEIG